MLVCAISFHVEAQELKTEKTNLEIINGLYTFLGKGDIPSVLGLMYKDIIWNEAEINSLEDGNPYVGPEAVLNGVFGRIGTTYKSFGLKDIELHDISNNKVLATLYYVLTDN